MAQQLQTFRFTTPLDSQIDVVTGTNTVLASDDASPVVYATALVEESVLVDVVHEYRLRGWAHEGAGNLLPTATPTLLRVDRARLTADASAIVGTSWTTVLSASLTTTGDSVLEIDAAGTAAVLLAAGDARITINGGSFSNTALAARILSILGAAPFSISWWLPVATSGSPTAYTVALQMRAGLTGSVTPQAGCSLIAREFST